MSTITITLSNRKFNLECPQEKHEQLIDIAAKIDKELKEIIGNNSNISFDFALVMLALKLMAFKQSEVRLSGGEALKNLEKEHQSEVDEFSSCINSLLEKVAKVDL